MFLLCAFSMQMNIIAMQSTPRVAKPKKLNVHTSTTKSLLSVIILIVTPTLSVTSKAERDDKLINIP